MSVEKLMAKHGNTHLNSEFYKSPFQCSMVIFNSPGKRVLNKDFAEYVYCLCIVDIAVPVITVAWEVNFCIVIKFYY